MRALVLTTYPVEEASRRLRVEPLTRELARLGVRVKVDTIFSPRAFRWKNAQGIRRTFALVLVLIGLMRRLAVLFNRAEILVVHREAFPFFTPLVERLAARNRIVSLLDIDDAIHLEPTHAVDWRSRFRKASKARDFSDIFHFISCGNHFLMEEYGEGQANCIFFPTCPEELAHEMEPEPQRPPYMVWSGSFATLPSLTEVVGDVLALCEEMDWHLKVMGGANILNLKPNPRLTVVPWSREGELRLIAGASMGLMPLPDSPWESGKSGYKAILYTTLGVPSVVTGIGFNKYLSSQFEIVRAAPVGDFVASLRSALIGYPDHEAVRQSRLMARDMFDAQRCAQFVLQTVLSGVQVNGRLI